MKPERQEGSKLNALWTFKRIFWRSYTDASRPVCFPESPLGASELAKCPASTGLTKGWFFVAVLAVAPPAPRHHQAWRGSSLPRQAPGAAAVRAPAEAKYDENKTKLPYEVLAVS